MPLTTENHFVCGLKKPNGDPDCNVDFYYNPGSQGKPPEWAPAVQVALNKIVALTHPLTNFTTFFCSDEHAILAIERGQHLPPMPPKVQPATEADVTAAKRGLKVVEGMREGAKPS